MQKHSTRASQLCSHVTGAVTRPLTQTGRCHCRCHSLGLPAHRRVGVSRYRTHTHRHSITLAIAAAPFPVRRTAPKEAFSPPPQFPPPAAWATHGRISDDQVRLNVCRLVPNHDEAPRV